MRLYESVWRGTWAMVATIGVGVAMLQWSALGVLLTLGPLAVFCWLIQQALADIVPGSVPWSASVSGLQRSFTVAVGIVAVCSFSWVSSPLGLFVTLTAWISSPTVVRRTLPSARRPAAVGHASAAAPPPKQAPVPEDVGEAHTRLSLPEGLGPLNGLDDQQLCRLWRDSFWLLRDASPSERMLCRVALREACLDELERRDAGALRAWLESGARASSGPEKFLAQPARRDPPGRQRSG